MIYYAVETGLSAAEFIDVLERSGLAERRPIQEPVRIANMLKHANLIVTARDDSGRLIGIGRSLTDFAFCCYMSDLAVDRHFQGQGVGRRLMEETRKYAGGDAVTFLLLAAPQAMTYYPHSGLEHFDNCFGIRRRVTG